MGQKITISEQIEAQTRIDLEFVFLKLGIKHLMNDESFTILHLSDAHIGHPLWTFDTSAVMRPLIEDLAGYSKGKAPNLIVFSGDLVFGEVTGASMESQFESARHWLQRMHQIWNLNLGDIPILFVPGNHDIQRSQIDEGQIAWIEAQTTLEGVERVVKSNTKFWKGILERQSLWWFFIKSIPNQPWKYEENLRIQSGRFTYKGKSIGLIGFNSSWFCGAEGEKGKLWFTKHQLLVGEEMIRDCDIKISVLHHPTSWFHPEEESWLEPKMASKFHITLHGHLHSGWYTHSDEHVCISAGACWNGSQKENAYSWIYLEPEKKSLKLSGRQYVDKGAGVWGPVQLPNKFSTFGEVNLSLSKPGAPTEPDCSNQHPADSVPTIAGTSDIAVMFPAINDDWISRTQLLSLLEESFDTTTHLVFLIGQEGVGKTIFAAQLSQKLALNCVSVFFESSPHWSTQIAKARSDLCNQAFWILTGNELPADVIVTEAILAGTLAKLYRHSRAKRTPIYIIIDGLNVLTRCGNEHCVEEVLSLFDTFSSSFRFVVTITPERVPERFRAVPYRTFQMPRFDREQCDLFLGETSLMAMKNEVWSLTRGHPTALASIRRILKKFPDTTIDQLSASLPDLFSFEWNEVDEKNSNQIMVLAALALFPQRFTQETLTSVLDIPKSEVNYAIDSLGFLTKSSANDRLVYLSEAFRNFAAVKLKKFENVIREKIIAQLLKTPNDLTTLKEVPLYLNESGRNEELLGFLSPEHLALLLQQGQSCQDAIEQTTLALTVAYKGEKIREYSRFALHKSSLCQFQAIGSSKSSVEALVALGRTAAAASFAESQMAKEHRLLLLAVVARCAKNKKLLLPPTVGESIQRLACDLPKSVEAELRLEIATELVPAYPELAIKVIESLADNRENIDSTLMNVSVRALANIKNGHLLEDSFESIAAKIGSEKVRRFTTAAGLVFGKTSALDALSRIKGIASAKDQIYMLRQWATSHPKALDARQLIEYALELVVKTTEFTPTALVLRQLAEPLPHLEKNFNVSVLAARFSEQVKLLQTRGFTEDYVHLQLILAQTEANYAEIKFKERLKDLYRHVSGLDDLSVKVSCIAMMCSKMMAIEWPDGTLFFNKLLDELDLHLHFLLETTADHYVATRSVIRSIHSFDPERAVKFALSLNTEPRRNQAIADLLTMELTREEADADTIHILLRDIANRDMLEKTVVRALGYVVDNDIMYRDISIANLISAKVLSFQGADRRVTAIVSLLVLFRKRDATCDLKALTEEMRRSWECIDHVAVKREKALQIVTELADIMPEEATSYWQNVEQISSQVGLTEISGTSMVCQNLILAIRLFKGLLLKGNVGNNEKMSILNQIEKVPSSSSRCDLLGDLALTFFRQKKVAEGNDIVENRILPLLEDIARKDRSLYEQTFVNVAVPVYLHHGPSARQKLNNFDIYYRNLALNCIASWLETRVPAYEPFTTERGGDLNISYNDLAELAGLLDIADDDSFIYLTITKIVATIISTRGKRTYTLQQQSLLATQLEKVIETKLPNLRYIKHEGYSIVARAEVLRIHGLRDDEFEKLLGRAQRLQNIADRAYVLALIASTLTTARIVAARKLLNESITLVSQISTYEDRVERYEIISSIASTIDKGIARDALKRAVEYVGSVESWRGGAHVRRIIDAAYKLDSHLAEELASKIDNDPARKRMAELSAKRDSDEKLRKLIAEGESLDTIDLDDLGSLNGVVGKLWGDINAGTAPGLKYTRCRELMKLASKVPLHEGLQTWNFIVENLVRLYENTEQSKSVLYPLFEAVMINGELAIRIAITPALQVQSDVVSNFQEFYSGTIYIPPGNRQKAIDEMEQWCIENVNDYVIVVDPTFRQQDLSLIKQLMRSVPECVFVIISSKGIQAIDTSCSSIEESYKKLWRQLAGTDDLGNVEIVLIGSGLTGELPLGYRVMLTRKGGLSVSIGFSQLGLSKEATIHRLAVEDSRRLEQEIDPFWRNSAFAKFNPPLSVTRFTLN